MVRKTIDQRRAEHAWDTVEQATKCHGGQDPKKFGSQAKKLPSRVVTSGLGQALAFLKAKNYAPVLLKRLGDWVLDKRQNPASSQPEPGDDALLHRIVQSDSDFMRRATDEVLAYTLWVNRFAEARGLKEDEE